MLVLLVNLKTILDIVVKLLALLVGQLVKIELQLLVVIILFIVCPIGGILGLDNWHYSSKLLIF